MDDTNHIGDTIRLPRPKIEVNDLGHSVWTAEVPEGEFELETPEVSTDPYNSMPLQLCY